MAKTHAPHSCPHCGEAITVVLRKQEFSLHGEHAEKRDVSEPGLFLRTFCGLYKKYRNGANYQPVRKRDIPNIVTMLKTYPHDRLAQMATVLLTTDEPWIAHTDRGIQVLLVKATWCDDRLKGRGL